MMISNIGHSQLLLEPKFGPAKGQGLNIASAELVKAVGFSQGGFAVLPPPAV